MITQEQLKDFENLTNFPMLQFLNESNVFFQSSFPIISNFYRGKSKSINKVHFENLDSLIKKSELCLSKFDENKKLFKLSYFWDILYLVEEINVKLLTTRNLSKFLRSSIIKGASKAGFLLSVTLDNGQTLEDVSESILNDENSEDDWVEIAQQNDLKESGWDIDGGKELLVRKRIFQSDLVTSFIDNTIGKRIFGKDFKNKITIADDDLVTLNYDETLEQSVNTLAQISKGDIPEFKSIGIAANLYKGVNYSQMNFSSINREIGRNFSTDDLFERFEILDIKYEQGDISIKYQVGTKLGNVLIKNSTI